MPPRSYPSPCWAAWPASSRLPNAADGGGVAGGANLLPRLYVDLYNAACSKDLPTVEKLHSKVMELSTSIYHVGLYQSSFLKGLKCALSCVGICNDFMAEPFHRFRQAEHEVIERYVKQLGITSEK